MDIYPVFLMKAIIAKDIEEMKSLGIYELAEEDVALCEFICISKIEWQETLRKGLTLIGNEKLLLAKSGQGLKDYKNWLIKHGMTKENKDDFKLVKEGGEVKLYKFVSSYSIDVDDEKEKVKIFCE